MRMKKYRKILKNRKLKRGKYQQKDDQQTAVASFEHFPWHPSGRPGSPFSKASRGKFLLIGFHQIWAKLMEHKKKNHQRNPTQTQISRFKGPLGRFPPWPWPRWQQTAPSAELPRPPWPQKRVGCDAREVAKPQRTKPRSKHVELGRLLKKRSISRENLSNLIDLKMKSYALEVDGC